jgi:hypothetical protein
MRGRNAVNTFEKVNMKRISRYGKRTEQKKKERKCDENKKNYTS